MYFYQLSETDRSLGELTKSTNTSGVRNENCEILTYVSHDFPTAIVLNIKIINRLLTGPKYSWRISNSQVNN